MNSKFLFKKLSGTVQMDEATKLRRSELIRTLPDGDYEIIIRKAVKWDVAKMRKYFHGPVLGFIKEQFKGVGCMYSKEQIKDYLKTGFGPNNDPPAGLDGVVMPKSTSEYDFDTYARFLKDINAWCIECFNCELPPSDEVE